MNSTKPISRPLGITALSIFFFAATMNKFRLTQLLIQLARKEEEEQNPAKRKASGQKAKFDTELINYVADGASKAEAF